ncbi:MAG: ABC transporter ATP-binding protein [Rhodospirillales bacterium]
MSSPLDATTRRLALRVWADWVRPYRWRVAVALVLMGAVALATGAYPLVIDWTFDALAAGDAGWIMLVPPVIVAVTAVRGGLLYAQTVATAWVVNRVVADLQAGLHRHLLSADLAQIQAEATGTLAARFTVDAEAFRNALNRTVTGSVRDSLTVVSLLASMLWLDWLLTLIVLCVYPVAAIPIVRIGTRLRRTAKGLQAGYGGLTAQLQEGLAGARMVKAYRLEDHQAARARAAFDGLRRQSMKAVRIRGALEPMLDVIGGVAVAAVIAFAAWRIGSGTGSVGDFTGFVGALLIAAQPVRALGSLNAALQEGLAAAERLYAVLDRPATIVDRPGATPLGRATGAIAFEGVTFAYRPGLPVLRGLDLAIAPGETVALVGRSGGGKSTILNLLVRLHDVDGGRITVDGRDLRDATIASLRDNLAVVGQDAVLFDDTVAANIAFGRPGATRGEIEAAARAAAAHDFVMALPQGYDTPVGEAGGRLSGGQRQRLAIARAFLRDAPILLLDEATSALDAESEQAVQEALARLATGRTTLVIAHRLSTVRAADRICVVEDGRVIEEGTHAALLARGGRYADLHAIQFAG